MRGRKFTLFVSLSVWFESLLTQCNDLLWHAVCLSGFLLFFLLAKQVENESAREFTKIISTHRPWHWEMSSFFVTAFQQCVSSGALIGTYFCPGWLFFFYLSWSVAVQEVKCHVTHRGKSLAVTHTWVTALGQRVTHHHGHERAGNVGAAAHIQARVRLKSGAGCSKETRALNYSAAMCHDSKRTHGGGVSSRVRLPRRLTHRPIFGTISHWKPQHSASVCGDNYRAFGCLFWGA